MGILDSGDFGIEITHKRRRLPPDTVIYHRIKCPKCGSVKVPVYNTRPKEGNNIIRDHKCEDCGHCFKSIETVS